MPAALRPPQLSRSWNRRTGVRTVPGHLTPGVREIDVQQGFDTGAIAWQQFNGQSNYKFAFYKTSRDIYHFGEMTWPKYKKADSPEIQQLLARRDHKLGRIREMLVSGQY